MRALTVLLLASLVLADPPPRPGYLGAGLADAEGGVQLTRVLDGSPAAAAGLRPGDLLVRFGEHEVKDISALVTMIRDAGEGAKIDLVVVRGGERTTVALTLGVNPQLLLEEHDPAMPPVRIEKDLSYAPADATPHERHKLNLFLPQAEGKFPIVLWIHAGAWSYGDRAQDTALAMRFAERGIGFAPMSYRLSSKAWNEPDAPKEGVRHPAHAEDCALAFAWLKKRFPGHPLFLAGHSCGAHLGALLGADPRYLAAHGLGLKDVAGVIAVGGGYDLVKYHAILADGIDGEPGLGKEKADAHLIFIFGDTVEDWIAASPTTYLEGCATPMLIVGERGASMRRYTQDFEEAVKAAGVTTIRFRYADDRTHAESTPLMSRKSGDPIRDEAIAFIREHAAR